MKVKPRPYRPWLPVSVRADNDTPLNRLNDLEINKADCVALQAVATGTANAEQQRRAISVVLHICGVGGMVWMPDEHGGERDTTFAAGKQHVGLQLRKLTSFPLNVLTGEQK